LCSFWLRGIAIIGGWGPGDYNSLADLVLETADLDRLRALVQADNAEGFLVFYSLVAPADYPIPLHCIKWIVEYYDCLRTSENLAIEAFRGSLKTTVMTIYLTAYRIGCSPHLENLFAQGNHRAAVENAQTVASIVKDQPMFRLLFPHVSPDIDKGWGADGYQVMRTDLPYGEWRQMRTKTPTLVGAGYKDALVLGKHPRGHGILDDVNNYLNTRSQRELNAVVHKVEKEIRPAFDDTMIQLDIFTPWTPDDVGDRAKRRPNTRHIKTAVVQLDEFGKATDLPTWPEKFPTERIAEIRANMPPAEFAQMYMCDLEAAQGQALKKDWLQWYLPENVKSEWPTYIGIDFASVASDQETKGKDHFALAVLKIHPNGFGLLTDGFFGHVPDAVAQDTALNWGGRYDSLKIMGIEALGKGESYYNWVLSKAPFRVKKLGTGNRNKGYRFEKQMAQMFRSGKVRVAQDLENPFIKQFYNEWAAFDGLGTYFDDCLDAVYFAIAAARNALKAGEGGIDPNWGELDERDRKRAPKKRAIFGFGKTTRD